MKMKETSNESWPELDENLLHSSTIEQTQNNNNISSSSITIDMTNSNELTPSITKDDLEQQSH